MPQCLIQGFEIADINQHQAELQAFSSCNLYLCIDAVDKQGAVGQASEGVIQRQLLNFIIGLGVLFIQHLNPMLVFQ